MFILTQPLDLCTGWAYILCSFACMAMSKRTKVVTLGDLLVDVHLVTCLAFKHWALFSGYQSNAPFYPQCGEFREYLERLQDYKITH